MKDLQVGDIIEIFCPKHWEIRKVIIKNIPFHPGQMWTFEDVMDEYRWSKPGGPEFRIVQYG